MTRSHDIWVFHDCIEFIQGINTILPRETDGNALKILGGNSIDYIWFRGSFSGIVLCHQSQKVPDSPIFKPLFGTLQGIKDPNVMVSLAGIWVKIVDYSWITTKFYRVATLRNW